MKSVIAKLAIAWLSSVLTSGYCRAEPPARPTEFSLDDAAVSRVWHDSTGQFSTRAILVGGDAKAARLRKANGVEIQIAFERLSDSDRTVARELLKARQDNASGAKPVLHSVAKVITSLAAEIPETLADPSLSSLIEAAANAKPLAALTPRPVPQNMIYIRVSRQMLEKMIARQVDRQAPLYDVILGAQVRGASHTVGRIESVVQPNTQVAVCNLRFVGATSFTSVGYAGPVRVYSSGETQFQSTKQIWMDSSGAHSSPAVTTAQTHSTITGVDSSLPRIRGRIASRIGSERAQETHAQVEAICADHTSALISRQFDQETDQLLADAWKNVNAQIATLPFEAPLRARRLKITSNRDGVEIIVIGSSEAAQFATAPALTSGTDDVVACVHRSLLKNLITSATSVGTLFPAALYTAMPGAPNLRPRQAQWSPDGQWLTIGWQARNEKSVRGTAQVSVTPAAIVAQRD